MDDAAPEPLAVDEPLFSESGASWLWVLAGPACCVGILAVQLTGGMPLQWVVPLAFLLLVSGFVALQIKAARIHTSVELTAETLRQGTEVLNVDEIVSVYPPPPADTNRTYYDDRILNRNAGKLAGRALEKAGLDATAVESAADVEAAPPPVVGRAKAPTWMTARTLGELSGVPRRRTAIGLRLSDKRDVQAWARNDEGLRAALDALLARRSQS